MTELRDRFNGVNRIRVPDLREAVEKREVSARSLRSGGSRAVVVTLAVTFVASLAYGATMLTRTGEIPPDAPSTPAPPTPDGSDTGEGLTRACWSEATFAGHRYGAHEPVTRPVPGEIVGVASFPDCTEQDRPGPGDPIEVARIDDVDPSVAVVTTDGLTLFLRMDLDSMPVPLRRYFAPPPCDPEDEPIELLGTWTGIFGADQHTEVDLEPPYDVYVDVREASSPAYARGEITVRVPESLGRPITREDVERSLHKGGDIHVVATCLTGPYTAKDGRPAEDGFMATAVEVFPGEESD